MARKKTPEDRTPGLGALVQRTRLDKGLTQNDLARALTERLGLEADEAIHQSWVARLEAGEVLPTRTWIECVGRTLGIRYGVLLGAVLRDRFLPKGCEDFAFPIEKGLITLRDLAAWEKDSAHKEVWVVAQKFVDHHLRDFFNAVADVVTSGGTFVFFLPDENDALMKRYQAQIGQHAKTSAADRPLGRLIHVPLIGPQRSLIANAFVIANPLGGPAIDDDEPYPNGYSILADEGGEPRLGMRLTNLECRELTGWLWSLKDDFEKAQTSQETMK